MTSISGFKKIINQQKYFMMIEFIFGINRINLFTNRKLYLFIGYLYTLGVWTSTIGCVVYEMVTTKRGFDLLLLASCCVEYPLLVLHVSKCTTQEIEIFKLLEKFDEKIKMDSIKVYNQLNFIQMTSIVCVLLSISWQIITLNMFDFHWEMLYRWLWIIARDLEQLFYVYQLRFVYLRLSLLKAHVRKIDKYNYRSWMQTNTLNKIEMMSERVDLDINTLHEAYEILHKCSTQLNRAMDIPLCTMIIVSGMLTTLSSNVVYAIMNVGEGIFLPIKFSVGISLCMAIQSIKLIVLVFLPCYYSSGTATQVCKIRAVLCEVIRTKKIDEERRIKLKTFLALVKDSNFAYRLRGTIKLDMSLPLTFLYMCLTYFIISINLNKFIYGF